MKFDILLVAAFSMPQALAFVNPNSPKSLGVNSANNLKTQLEAKRNRKFKLSPAKDSRLYKCAKLF